MDEALVLVAAGALAMSASAVFGPTVRLLLWVRGGRRRAEPDHPVCRVSIIVPAYNEERHIVRKLENLRAAIVSLDGVTAEVLIGSDGSSDRTAEIAEEWIRRQRLDAWKVVRYENEGKCQTINKLVGMSSGQVVISTDADVLTPPSALRRIVDAFGGDASLGCVSCVPVFSSDKTDSQRRYWSVERSIRAAESDAGMLIVVTGWLYAYRRAAFRPIAEGVMADDLWTPLAVLLQGYSCVQLEDLPVASEPTDEATEARRRRRVIAGGMDVVWRLWRELSRKPALLLIVLAHKVTRWALPLWILLVVVGLVLYAPIMAIPIVLALLWLASSRHRGLAVGILSPVGAVIDLARSRDLARWEHTRKG